MTYVAMLIRFWLWLLIRLGIAHKPDLSAQLVAANPPRDAVRPGRLLVVGGPGYRKWAYFRCPCGCSEIIMLSLNQSRRPRWTVTLDNRGRPTVDPSVRQTAGCFSHFWIRAGMVEWCADTGKPTLGRALPS